MQDAVLVEMAAIRPASTSCSWTPVTTSPRPSAPADAVEAVYGVNIVNVTPEQTVAEQDELVGKDPFASELPGAATCARYSHCPRRSRATLLW